MRKILRIIRDVAYISMGKYGAYVVTLITIPLTARTLGLEGIGLLAISTGAYFFGSAIVDFGLTQLLAARAAAGSGLEQLRTSYLLLRLSLILPLLLFLIIAGVVPSVPAPVFMVALGLVGGGLTSCGEDWVLIGRMMYGRLAIFQIIARCTYLAALVLAMITIPSPAIAMACLAGSSLVSIFLTWTAANRSGRLGRATRGSLLGLMAIGWPAFLSRLMSTGYQQGATVVYSAVLSASSLGLYSSAEKVVRAAASALDALSIALLPRMAKREIDADFWHAVRSNLLFGCIAGALLSGFLFGTAPFVVSVLFGPEFAPVVPLLQIQSAALPVLAFSSLGISTVLYVKRDTRGVLGAAIVGLGSTAGVVALATAFANATTLSIGLVVTEALVSIYVLLRIHVVRRRESTGAKVAGPTPQETSDL